MADIQEQNKYMTYAEVRKLPYQIINKLMTDNEELWKLLKYTNTVGVANLTLDEKRAMICPDSINADNYNVVLQKFSEEAMTSDSGNVFAQLRIQVLGGYSLTPYNGKVSVVIQLVVTDKKMVCSTDVTPYDNRAFAMCQEVIACLNGKPLNIEGNYLFMNNDEDYNGEFKLVNFNKEYSGYVLVMSANITS